MNGYHTDETFDMRCEPMGANQTPRTDALLAKNNNDWHNPQLAAIDFTDLARTLERELAEARKAVKAGNDARREAARLREALRALDDTGVLDLPRGIRAEGAVIAARALLAPSGR